MSGPVNLTRATPGGVDGQSARKTEGRREKESVREDGEGQRKEPKWHGKERFNETQSKCYTGRHRRRQGSNVGDLRQVHHHERQRKRERLKVSERNRGS